MELISTWRNERIYLFSFDDIKAIVSITRIKDRKGTLLQVQSSITNDFETYGMKEVKQRLIDAANEQVNKVNDWNERKTNEKLR